MTFEQYLQEVHAKNYHGTDDDMPDNLDSWLTDLQIDDVIAYAENWHTQEMKSIRAKGANTTNSKYSKEQRSEWARKGGRPKSVDKLSQK